jgi:hypothetical protein
MKKKKKSTGINKTNRNNPKALLDPKQLSMKMKGKSTGINKNKKKMKRKEIKPLRPSLISPPPQLHL